MTRPTYFLLAFAFVMSHTASAQFFAGFSGGMNLSNSIFRGEFIFPESSFSTFAFGGLHSGYKLHDKWTFTTDLQFSQKGYSVDSTEFVDPVPSTYARYSYLDLVPQMEYEIHKHVAIGAGIYVSKLLHDAYSTSSTNEWVHPAGAPFVSGMDAGAVGSLKLKFQNFFIFTRYQHGLVNILKYDYTDVNGMEIDVRQRISLD